MQYFSHDLCSIRFYGIILFVTINAFLQFDIIVLCFFSFIYFLFFVNVRHQTVLSRLADWEGIAKVSSHILGRLHFCQIILCLNAKICPLSITSSFFIFFFLILWE